MSADLAATVASLEAERKTALRSTLVRAGALVALGAAAALILKLTHNGDVSANAFVIGLVGAVVLAAWLIQRLQRRFKRRIMPILARSIDPSLRYDALGFVSEQEFTQAGLFKKPDRYRGVDLVEGKIGQTAVKFSLVHAEEKHTHTVVDDDGNTSVQRYRTLFCGLWFIADFNKHFSARTKIEPHAASFLDKLFGSHVEMEDAEFNRHFSVSSTDQVEARYVLTPSLMARLDHLRTKAAVFRIAFVDEHVILAIDCGLAAFEPSVMRPLAKSGQVEMMLDRLKSVTGIVEDLDLNTRIWTKV